MELLLADPTVSDFKKRELRMPASFADWEQIGQYLTGLLRFAICRPFVKRENKKLTTSGKLSRVLTELIYDAGVPRPCRWFVGRERELEQLHQLLQKEHHVFLHGIPGIEKANWLRPMPGGLPGRTPMCSTCPIPGTCGRALPSWILRRICREKTRLPGSNATTGCSKA